MNFNTPILFLIFNRPDTTEKVFSAIKKIQPKYLYVAADGARPDKAGERDKCEEVRNIVIDGVDWDCELKTLFRDENLGCGDAVSQAIDWFFSQVEEGIILEDDCLPSPSFFEFCSHLLQRYRNDSQVMMISGFSLFPPDQKSNEDYFFNHFAGIWGWATWKRAWQKYEFSINSYDPSVFDVIENDKVKAYYSKTTDLQRSGQLSTWDIQWLYTTLMSKSVSIVPLKNMIKNIGFVGTHANNSISLSQNRDTELVNVSQLRHPHRIQVNRRLASLHNKKIEWVLNNGNSNRGAALLLRRVKQFIKDMIS